MLCSRQNSKHAHEIENVPQFQVYERIIEVCFEEADLSLTYRLNELFPEGRVQLKSVLGYGGVVLAQVQHDFGNAVWVKPLDALLFEADLDYLLTNRVFECLIALIVQLGERHEAFAEIAELLWLEVDEARLQLLHQLTEEMLKELEISVFIECLKALFLRSLVSMAQVELTKREESVDKHLVIEVVQIAFDHFQHGLVLYPREHLLVEVLLVNVALSCKLLNY